MRKLKALGMITLTLTSMIPLTANAAVTTSYSQCYGGKNVTAIYGSYNLDDLKAKLQQYGIDGNCVNWSKPANDNNTGKPGKGTDSNTDTDNNNNDNSNNDTDTGTDTDNNTGNQSYTQQVVDLVNAERAKEGLAPLTIDPLVEKAATVRANEIQSNFDHVRPNGSSFSTAIKEQGATFRGAGENIAWGQRTPQEVVNAWMNSPGHRANIMNTNYTHIGVGNTQNSSGTQYWVQLFTY